MTTRFYNILYKGNIVYVGVTTRTVDKRFNEHIKQKYLNRKNYSCVEIDKIIHPKIKTIEEFYNERQKVKFLEQKYIRECKNNGIRLLNISDGGEWGCSILNKLKKENFFKKYGTYDGYVEWKNKKEQTKQWLKSWIKNRTENKTKVWLRHWISHRTENKTKYWLRSWINNRTENKTKVWLRNWISHRTENKTKVWLRNWISHRTEKHY